MQKSAVKENQTKYYTIVILCVALMFFGGYIPPFSSYITPIGMQVLGIFIGMVVLWSTIGGVIWPSILAIVALGMSDYTTMNAALASAFGQVVIWQMVMCVTLTSAITWSGAGEYLARWFVSQKFLRGRPMLFTFVYFVAFTIIAALTNGVGMMLLAWTILKGIAKLMDKDMSEPYFKVMSVFTMVAVAYGEFIIPYKSWIGALWSAFGKIVGQELNYLPYMAITLSLGLIMDLFLTLFIKFGKFDVSFLENFDNSKIQEKNKDEKLNQKQIAYLVAMLCCILIAASSNIFPVGSAIYNLTNGLTTFGIFAIGVVALLLVRGKDGKPMLDFREVMAKGTFWGPLFIVASAVPVATALCSEATGFMELVTNLLNPIFASSSLRVIYLVIIVATVFLTNLGSNTGIAMMMLPIAVPLAISAGANMYIVGICVIYSACYGFMLPGSSAISALVYGVRENHMLKSKDIIKYTGIVCIAYCIVAAIIFPILDKLLVM